MELTPEIRLRLKSIMESRHDTGYTLHKKLGISATTIGNYLKGKVTRADTSKLTIMCEYWGIDLTWLETGQDMVKSSESTETSGPSAEGNIDHMLKQILLKLSSKNDQFINIRKDIQVLRENLGDIKKEVAQLKQEITNLKSEIQNVKEK